MKLLKRLLGCKSKKYVVEIRQGDSGSFYWRIVSAVNGQVVATSETYSAPGKCADTAMNVGEDAGFEVTVIQ